MYDLGAMKLAVVQCEKNIKVFEEAIQKEQTTRSEYLRIIRDLEFKATQAVKAAEGK